VSVIIQKFGGKLLETPDHIRRVAAYIIRTKAAGDDPVVVVSAPGSTTDRFLELAHQITEQPDKREIDMLLSVGERTAMALLAMAINADGRYRAVSFTGSQVGIITDTRHTDARILEVRCLRIREALERGEIPIVAGFQGVSTEREITTLGRGGSDATAVALAAALGAERCELVKEKGAVFSADPELVAEAVFIPEIDYGTLEELTAAGGRIVQPRAVSLAREHGVALTITDQDGKRGTLVTDRSLATGAVAAVVLAEGLRIIQAQDLAGNPPTCERIEENNVCFSVWHDNYCITAVKDRTNASVDKTAALLSVIGFGGSLNPEVAGDMAEVLIESGTRTVAGLLVNGRLSLLIESAKADRTALAKVHERCLSRGYINK
jgi:aspartate kinase